MTNHEAILIEYLNLFDRLQRLNDISGDDFRQHYEFIKAQITDDLAQCRQMVLANGILEQEWLTMQFALVAYIDESIINTDWSGRDEWLQAPLQYEIYHCLNAGEDFYRRLNELLVTPKQNQHLLWPFYLVLSFGFVGQYSQNPEQLIRLRETLASILSLEQEPQTWPDGNNVEKSHFVFPIVVVVLMCCATIGLLSARFVATKWAEYRLQKMSQATWSEQP